jgi:hypothetical protein
MKQKLKKLKLLLTISLAGLLLNSCQEEFDESYNESKNSNLVKEYTFKQASQIPKFNNAYHKFEDGLNRMKMANKSEDSDFVIDSTTVKEITLDKQTTYTMAIKRPTPTPDYFENLIVQVNNGDSTRAYITKYIPNQEMKYHSEHNSYDFNGTMQIKEIVFDTSSFHNKISTVCVTIMICEASYLHFAEAGCTQISSFTWCSDLGDFGVTFNYGTSGSGSTSTGGGSSGGAGGVITSPVVPLILDISNEKPCEELTKLSNDNAIKSSINILETKTQGDKEFGYAVKKSTTTPNTFAPPTIMAVNPKNPKTINIPAYMDGSWLGLEHNHPNPRIGAPMFSGADVFDGLHGLANAANSANPGQTINYQEFFITLTCYDVYSGTDMTFAIKIKDWNAFNTFVNTSAENVNNFSKELTKEYMELYAEAWNNDPNAVEGVNIPPTIDKLEKAFLKLAKKNNLGVGLYQADADLNGWSELNLDPLERPMNPKPIVKTPCN